MQKKEDALKGVKLFVLDMDGTVYLGDQLIEGALDFIREVDASEDRDFIFFTNNASRVPAVYVEKLHKLGLDVDESKVVTAGNVCAEFLKVNYPGARVYLNGTPVLEENWKEKGINLVEEDPDVAVQSFDTTLTYHKLDRICHYVRNGVPFIATHMDTNCPTEYGFMPDCGAMCQGYERATGRTPVFIGKPHPEMIFEAMKKFSASREDTVVIGDRLYTDIASGNNAGVDTLCVLSGEVKIGEINAAQGAQKPTYVLAHVNQLI